LRDKEKQMKHWQQEAKKFEQEKDILEGKLVDQHAKPALQAASESKGRTQLDELQRLKDEVFYLQEQNRKLEKTV